MENFIIREAEEKDASSILSFMKQVGGESDNLTFGKEGLPFSEEEEKAFLKSKKEDLKTVMYLALEGDRILGVGDLRSLDRRMSHRGEIGLSVRKDSWNKGIGTALMEKLISYGKSIDMKLISLEVKSDNYGAIHLYEKVGFQRIGTFPAFHKIGDEYADFEIMVLDLR